MGYARVSTKGQLLDRQIHALTEARCIRIFSDKKSGKNAEREEVWKALDYLREGDTLAVSSTASPRSSHRRFRPGSPTAFRANPPAAAPCGSCICRHRVTVWTRCAHSWGSPMIAPSSEVMSCQAESRVRSAPRRWRRSW
ncbi:recombinase family protein [Streptomyces sp. NPDC087290]|uniref:recombinase family protein n=1 Tax=Streptomyces sp. NPDC087290 TaxID=3365776 RepID=UPI00382F2663